MKRVLFFLVILVFTFSVQAQKKYEHYTVASYKGLTLRIGPSVDSAKIIIIPKGGNVSIAEDVDSNLSYAVTEFPGFAVKGHWVKVHYNLGQEGYVFSGYLSKFPPLFRYITPEGHQSNEGIYEYLVRRFPNRDRAYYYNSYDTLIREVSYQFSEGINYHHRYGESSLSVSIEFSQHSFQEVYLFFLLVTEPYSKVYWDKELKEILGFEPISEEPSEQIGCDYRIYKKDKKIILELFYTC
ncbi:hypothetical protein BH09BAC1_BH09BAC1_02940 [soil metagenome]